MLSRYDRVYVCLGGLFISALITCNLIVQKFFATDLFGLGEHFLNPIGRLVLGSDFKDTMFILSVGILPYPVTFLITDIISEIYGRKRANLIVLAGFFASIFTILIITTAKAVSAMDGSRVDDDTFDLVFGMTGWAITASMVAYLVAQFVDIRIYHFWRKLTKEKHLWLRNNASTLFSQLLDTTLVITILFYHDDKMRPAIPAMILSGFLFKALCALVDTPIMYAAVAYLKPRLRPDDRSSRDSDDRP